jgi:hypothetical protein
MGRRMIDTTDTDDLPDSVDHLRVWGRCTVLVALAALAVWMFTPVSLIGAAVLALVVELCVTVKVVQSWWHWGTARAFWWWR